VEFTSSELHDRYTALNNVIRRMLPYDRENMGYPNIYVIFHQLSPDIQIMEERGAPLLGKARGTSENLGRETRENDNKPVAQRQYVVSDTRCPALHDCELE